MSYSRGSTPSRGDYAGYPDDYFTSASTTPSPRHYAAAYSDYPPAPPQRSATRASHSRHKSASFPQHTPLPARPPTAHGYSAEGVSPRFTSGGVYATANVHLPARAPQMPAAMDNYAPPPPPTPQSSRRASHIRRPSTSVPQQRSQTARPPSSHPKKSTATQPEPRLPEVRAATEEDARKHRVPEGYSLTHWDPTEQPILLLGSVFDANSLGKWIYDWTVYHFDKGHPIANMAGDLWLLLIQISGKVKRADEVMPSIRKAETRDMVEDFIESGDRLTDKLRKLLKRCETPMLKHSKRSGQQLAPNAGVEFVLTLFGRDRELAATEKFMASVRLWNLRFDANCEEVLLQPGK